MSTPSMSVPSADEPPRPERPANRRPHVRVDEAAVVAVYFIRFVCGADEKRAPDQTLPDDRVGQDGAVRVDSD